MKKLLLTSAAFASLVAGPAMAADQAVRVYKRPRPVVVAAPVYSWTGFYVGGNGGYSWKDSSVTFSPVDPLVQSITCGQGNCPNPVFFNLKGGLGGIQTGYNWQISRKALLGLEADIEWSKIQGAGTANFLFDFSPSNFQADQSVRWFGTIRGRAGYLPVDNLLIFLTGGLAYGRIEENVSLNSGFTGGFAIGGGFSLNCITGPSCFFGNSSRISTGWTAGAGIEYALWSNVSLKAEYLYVNLGSGDTINVVTQSTLPASPPAAPSSFTAAYSRTDFNIVRVGLNYKFGNYYAPVVTK